MNSLSIFLKALFKVTFYSFCLVSKGSNRKNVFRLELDLTDVLLQVSVRHPSVQPTKRLKNWSIGWCICCMLSSTLINATAKVQLNQLHCEKCCTDVPSKIQPLLWKTEVALPRVFNVILWIADCNPIELSCCQPIPHAIGFHFN